MNKGPAKGGFKGGMPGGRKIDGNMLKRVLKMLFEFYPVLAPIAVMCILISAAASALPPIFMQQVIAEIESAVAGNIGWAEASGAIIPKIRSISVKSNVL